MMTSHIGFYQSMYQNPPFSNFTDFDLPSSSWANRVVRTFVVHPRRDLKVALKPFFFPDLDVTKFKVVVEPRVYLRMMLRRFFLGGNWEVKKHGLFQGVGEFVVVFKGRY